MELALILQLIFFHCVCAKILILPEEGIEKCSEYADVDAKYFNVDNVSIIVESDFEIFVDGSAKIMKPLKSPWKSEYFAEQLNRNEWVRSPIQKKFNDLCLNFHNPLELWYQFTKNLPGCPFASQVNVTLSQNS